MLCAGVENTILSGCHGDSGGPYVCLNADGKTYTLHGAVSWGSGQCNARQLFTVFARVTQFRAWIKQHTGIGGGGGGGGVEPLFNIKIVGYSGQFVLSKKAALMGNYTNYSCD